MHSYTKNKIELLRAMLKEAEAESEAEKQTPEQVEQPAASLRKFAVRTFNAISPLGLARLPKELYACSGSLAELPDEPMAIMLRSHKLKEEEVAPTVRCVARCGAGTNNIPVARMTELGIPVFNTPGANANAVKELVTCGILLASRGIVEGARHVRDVVLPEVGQDHSKVEKRIEADKALFAGQEVMGRTLGVVGLGQVGARVVEAGLALGMHVVGYDPALTLDAALRLPGSRMERTGSLQDLLRLSDYVTLHVPYIPDLTHHLINEEVLPLCKPGMHLLNFARDEIVDGAAIKSAWDSGSWCGKYVADFANKELNGHPKFLCLPHLGASTAEAEENSAAMAADTMRLFLETGSIRHSVNFPNLQPQAREGDARLCVVHKNEPGVLGELTGYLGSQKINIAQQLNSSVGKIAYTIIDMQDCPPDPAGLQEALVGVCPEIISLRFLGRLHENEMGQPGTFFYVRWANSK
mmetsp:Transcript_89976/g.226300  ORF Transcript_89976/g.226300 Transcript_89976/m.226300 type:complete len:468 (-) Transcript_89976:62-1465(-)